MLRYPSCEIKKVRWQCLVHAMVQLRFLNLLHINYQNVRGTDRTFIQNVISFISWISCPRQFLTFISICV